MLLFFLFNYYIVDRSSKISMMPRSVTFSFLQVLFNFADSTSFVAPIDLLFAFAIFTFLDGKGGYAA